MEIIKSKTNVVKIEESEETKSEKPFLNEEIIKAYKIKFKENPFTAFSDFKKYLKDELEIKNNVKVKSLWDEILNN